MSTTVRSWSNTDLAKIEANTDPFLTTVFLNKKTFSLEQIRAYPYQLRRTFVVDFGDGEIVTVYATDVDSLHKFLATEYHAAMIVGIVERHTSFTRVTTNERSKK